MYVNSCILYLSLSHIPPPLPHTHTCHLNSKKDSGLLVRVIPLLSFMVDDDNSSVVKRFMTCVMQLYRPALMVGGELAAGCV